MDGIALNLSRITDTIPLLEEVNFSYWNFLHWEYQKTHCSVVS